jgi:hypothetical protein
MPPVKENRPSNNPYWQQRMRSWDPVVTPCTVIAVLFIIGIVFIPVGSTIVNHSNVLFESEIIYGGKGSTVSCAGTTCQLVYDIPQDIQGPLYVYYGITNMYQNNIKYQKSVNFPQLNGEKIPDGESVDCEPLLKTDGQLRNPCGLIAGSFFSDIIKLSTQSLINGQQPTTATMNVDKKEINQAVDTTLFNQPKDFKYVDVANCGVTCASVGLPDDCTCTTDPVSNTQYMYWYPNDASTLYLYEMYPNNIRPKYGVKEPHFMNWMNIAALPNFRKLYGVIKSNFKKGDRIVIEVDSTYDVSGWEGSKSVVVSQKNRLGLPNPQIGSAYISAGAIALSAAIVLFVKQKFFPRPAGSPTRMGWQVS